MHTGIKKPLDLENTRVWKPLEFGNHWYSETTGIWKPLAFRKPWYLETTGLWIALPFGTHWNWETTPSRTPKDHLNCNLEIAEQNSKGGGGVPPQGAFN